MTGNTNVIQHYGDFSCDAPSTDIASLKIEPQNFHLTCENNRPFYVVPYNSDGERLYDVDGATITFSEVSTNKLSVSGGSFNTTNGRFEYS
ncbi:hypothetical protein [Vibrio sonorensis]|uniref:hypothetical protein n=1 Tax=Vibrio sonorensis TaxID=1004316 RepID=UPI0008DA3E20|nr:hypothetical protein [Vibrio sonorensis]